MKVYGVIERIKEIGFYVLIVEVLIVTGVNRDTDR